MRGSATVAGYVCRLGDSSLPAPLELVVAAVAAADFGEVGHELPALDPLHLLEPELGFVAQPQRLAVRERQRLTEQKSARVASNRLHPPDCPNAIMSVTSHDSCH